ncbi:MAG: hypothetical protein Q4D38_13895 [Planctomycetia bacterium]|nr:hypothetical protein [Planctomycetia bacterium]
MTSLFRFYSFVPATIVVALCFLSTLLPLERVALVERPLFAQGFDDDFGSEDEEADSEEEADEFADEEEDSEDEVSEDDADEQESAPADSAEGENVSVEVDPFKPYQLGDAAMNEILARDPQTPLEHVDCAQILTELARYDKAREFYRRARNLELSDEDLDALLAKYGRAFFVSLSANPRLKPHGEAFGRYVLESMEKRYENDEEFINKIIDQLNDPDPDRRRIALGEIQGRRSVAIPLLISAYAESDDESRSEALRDAILRFGEIVTPALSAVLDSGDETLQISCVELLTIQAMQKIHSARVALYRAAAFTSKDQELVCEYATQCLEEAVEKKKISLASVAQVLQEEIQKVQKEKTILERDDDPMFVHVLWRWNATEQALFCEPSTRLAGARLDAYRLARALWNLYPKMPIVRKHLFICASEYVVTFSKEIQSAPLKSATILETDEFTHIRENYSVSEVESYLDEGLTKGLYDASVVAALFLGEMGTEDVLHTNAPGLSNLARALSSPHRLLRFTALETIMKLNPKAPYAGSSRVVEALSWFLAAQGNARVLIGDISFANGNVLGGRFASRSFEFDVACSGRELLAKAFQSSDYSLILIDMEMIDETPDLILQQLRLDARTADIPIVLIAQSEYYKLAERLSQKLAKSVWFPRPATDDDLDLLLTLSNRVRTSANIPVEQRQAEIRQCLVWAHDIILSHRSGWVPRGDFKKKDSSLESPLKVYDVTKLQEPILKIAPNPRFLNEAIEALSALGTPRAQEMLIFLANSGNYDHKASVSAAEALKKNTLSYGVLLKTDRIADLYEEYNSTRGTQKRQLEIRGLILDALEAPLQTSVSQAEAFPQVK